MEGFNTYKIKQQYGIDDLMQTYAWVGNSQGDTSATNNTMIGQASEGWMSFVFDGIDQNDQDAIDKESIRREEANKVYVAELKKRGEYGKEYEITIHMKPNPLFDTPQIKFPLESSKMIFIGDDDKPKSPK